MSEQYWSDDGNNTDVSLLVSTTSVGRIIGRRGCRIKRLRAEYDAYISISDLNCDRPESILTISADMNSVLQILNEIVQDIDHGNCCVSEPDNVELRLLVHPSQVGCIIGFSGSTIKRIQHETGTYIYIYQCCCPQSIDDENCLTDRDCHISGYPSSCIDAIRSILELIEPSTECTNSSRNYEDLHGAGGSFPHTQEACSNSSCSLCDHDDYRYDFNTGQRDFGNRQNVFGNGCHDFLNNSRCDFVDSQHDCGNGKSDSVYSPSNSGNSHGSHGLQELQKMQELDKKMKVCNITPGADTMNAVLDVVDKLKEENTRLKNENSRLKEERLCKICNDLETSIVFLPCGHLVTCVECAAKVMECPICRRRIRQSFRTFFN